MWCIIHSEELFSHDNEGYLPICDNMDGLWVHYANWNKSDQERLIWYDTTHKNIQSIHTYKSWAHRNREQNESYRGWGVEKWGDVGQRVQTSSYKVNKFWASNVQNATFYMVKTAVNNTNCILEICLETRS